MYIPQITPHINLQKSPEVFAELILGQPLFTGKDGVDQLVGVSVGICVDLCGTCSEIPKLRHVYL